MKNAITHVSILLNVALATMLLFGYQHQQRKQPAIAIEHELFDNLYIKAENHICVAVEGSRVKISQCIQHRHLFK